MFGSFAEAVVVIRRRAGIPVRAIPFGGDIYSTGMVAADRVPDEVVVRMVAALRDALQQQRLRPERGMAALCGRFPVLDPGRVAEEWSALEDYLFAYGEPASMDAGRWRTTLEHMTRTHGFSAHALAEVCRERQITAPVGAR